MVGDSFTTGAEGGRSGNKMPTLEEFGTNLTKLAEEGKLDPVVRRAKQIERCIGATTREEYRKHIEKDPALKIRFQPVKVPEPTVDEAVEILREIHHMLRYTDEALVAAAELSFQYIRYVYAFTPMGAILVPSMGLGFAFVRTSNLPVVINGVVTVPFPPAIGLIDEGGFRLRNAQLPEEVRELEKELRQIRKEKNGAVLSHEYGKASEFKDKEMDRKVQISNLVYKGKEQIKAENEANDSGPVVTEVDIQHIIST
ncbi:hypothetical protein GIB67_025261 [Kingdonia uniflora]|uniref:Uncharacterized protein n=1 Tax=Kingdonia uniflora TaxID=39325 RepID=A0A7J7NBA7_9MAGN|nr:hypothetical protein GIB67_025261 [Kingdonia uniflora]